MKLLCWIWGHDWSQQYDLVLGTEAVSEIAFCKRCGDYKIHDYMIDFLSH